MNPQNRTNSRGVCPCGLSLSLKADFSIEKSGIIPADLLLKIKNGKNAKDNKGDDFLDGLELRGGKRPVADAVGRHLETIFREGDQPADQDGERERSVLVFQMPVPREGHEDVGNDQEDDGCHKK